MKPWENQSSHNVLPHLQQPQQQQKKQQQHQIRYLPTLTGFAFTTTPYLIQSMADSSDGRAGDCGTKGPWIKTLRSIIENWI